MTALEHLRELHESMLERYHGDCAVHAHRIAQSLLAEGKQPWIGRVRKEDRGIRYPLIATRYRGRGSIAWTTHYVACAGRDAYDPILGAPIELDQYTEALFGETLAVVRDDERTARVLERG